MNAIDKVINIFENPLKWHFQKFGRLLINAAKNRNIVECCDDILILRLKIKRHFKELAELLEFQLPESSVYSEEEYKKLHAIYEMAYTLLYVPSSYGQTKITDELKRITNSFIDTEWNINLKRSLFNYVNPAIS